MQKANGRGPRAAPIACGRAISGLFHSPPGVLFTFPSWYSFAIGHRLVFSLAEWSPRVRAGFHVSRPTRDPGGARQASGTGLSPPAAGPSRPFPSPRSFPLRRSHDPGGQAPRFRRARVRSPLLAGSLSIPLPPGTEMFHFPGSRPRALSLFGRGCAASRPRGFPHSGTPGSKDACSSPGLFAACCALPRHTVPRHPSRARIRLAGAAHRAAGPGYTLRLLSLSTPNCCPAVKDPRPAPPAGGRARWFSEPHPPARPPRRGGGGRAWSRTRDLVLIRDAL